MDCPQCGYALDAFEIECPKCARMKALGKDPNSAPTTTLPPTPTLATQASQFARDTIRSMKPEPLFHFNGETPEYGWPMAIACWTNIGLNGLMVLLILLVIIMRGIDIGVFFLMIYAAARIGGALLLMRGSKWGFRLVLVFSLLPAIRNIIMHSVDFAMFIYCIIPAIPAAVALIMALTMWDEFE